MFIEVPTYENGQWTTTSFSTRNDFKNYLVSIFKEPGKYQFDESFLIFNAEARKFRQQGFYCSAPFKSKDFIHFVFAFLMISLFLTESFLWRQRGVVFFTMLYCLFNSGIVLNNSRQEQKII